MNAIGPAVWPLTRPAVTNAFASAGSKRRPFLGLYLPGWTGASPISVPITYSHVITFALTPSANYSGDGTVTNTYTSSFNSATVQLARKTRKVMVSVGGAGGGIYLANRTMTTNLLNSTIAAINAMGGVDGVDMNFFETFSAPAPDGKFPASGASPRAEWVTQADEMIWYGQQLKAAYGQNFLITIAPAPGTDWAPFDQYLAPRMIAADALDIAIVQLYDSSDFASIPTVVSLVNDWCNLIGEKHVAPGFGANYSTTVALSPADCATAYAQIKTAHPRIGGACGWSYEQERPANFSFANTMYPVVVGGTPPIDATGSKISYVSGGVGVNTIGSMPPHQAGDLLLFFAYVDGSATPPVLPAGWTNITTVGGNTNGARLAYKLAASSTETAGTWTNATSVICQVYRGVNQTTPIGNFFQVTASSANMSYRNITPLAVVDGTSWVTAFGGHRSTDGDITKPPPGGGMVNRTSTVDAVDRAAGHDSNGPLVAWDTYVAATGGTASGYATITCELRSS